MNPDTESKVLGVQVGIFRQGRTVKGKSGPPLCVEVTRFHAVNQ